SPASSRAYPARSASASAARAAASSCPVRSSRPTPAPPCTTSSGPPPGAPTPSAARADAGQASSAHAVASAVASASAGRDILDVICCRLLQAAPRAASLDAAMASHPRTVPLPQRRDVRLHIVAGGEQRPDADAPRRIVEIGRQDRHVGLVRDLPEARLPALHAPARALGG